MRRLPAGSAPPSWTGPIIAAPGTAEEWTLRKGDTFHLDQITLSREGQLPTGSPFNEWVYYHLFTFWPSHQATLSEDQMEEGSLAFNGQSHVPDQGSSAGLCNQGWPWRSSHGHLRTFRPLPGETMQLCGTAPSEDLELV